MDRETEYPWWSDGPEEIRKEVGELTDSLGAGLSTSSQTRFKDSYHRDFVIFNPIFSSISSGTHSSQVCGWSRAALKLFFPSQNGPSIPKVQGACGGDKFQFSQSL